MGKLKVGDKVRSLVTQIDVRAGELYEAARSDADSGVWVIDDVGDQFYLTNEEFEILPVATPTFEVGDRVQTIADSLPWYRAGEVAEVVIADDGDDDCFVRFNSDRMASDSWYVKWKHIQLAPLKIEAGKYYRTRDGRKVGPMNAAESEGYAFSGALVGVGWIKIFQSTGAHGSRLIGSDPNLDLIAEWIYACIGRMPDLSGIIPFAECKFTSSDGTVRILYNNKPSSSAAYFQSVTNTAVTANVYPDSHQGKFGYQDIPAAFGYSGWAIRPTTQASGIAAHISNDQEFMTAMIWDLPCNNVPIPKPSGTPIAGQVAFEASPTRIKLARPGFSTDTATGRQLIMDSDRTPIKVVMMGTTPAIAPGTNLFVPKPTAIDFDLSPSMVCDVICSLNGWDFAIPPVNLNDGLTEERTWAYYRVEHGGIRFSVAGTHAVTFKYMLYATGLQGYTSGGSTVIRKVEGQYLQIKRPGSSDVAPGYNDILLDTRFAAVTVLAESYVPTTSFTESASVHWRYGKVGHRINFDPQGLFIFPKVIYDFGNFYRNGTHDMYITPGSLAVEPLRYSTSTVVRDDHIVMHMNPGNSPGPNVNNSFPNPVGVRYYILGATTL